MRFGPCEEYPRERIESLLGKKPVTALDILMLEIPDDDKLWAVTREEFIDESILHEYACWNAENALRLIPNPDSRSIAAIKARRDWMCGEISDEQMAAARVATWVAAGVASWTAARAAAGVASWEAARAAARAAQVAYLINVLS